MQFESHGNFKIWRKGQIVFAELKGSWNLETAVDYENKIKKIVLEFTED